MRRHETKYHDIKIKIQDSNSDGCGKRGKRHPDRHLHASHKRGSSINGTEWPDVVRTMIRAWSSTTWRLVRIKCGAIIVPDATMLGVFMPTVFCTHAQTGGGAPQSLATFCADRGFTNTLIARNMPRIMTTGFAGTNRLISTRSLLHPLQNPITKALTAPSVTSD